MARQVPAAAGGPGGDGWPGRWLEAAAAGYISV